METVTVAEPEEAREPAERVEGSGRAVSNVSFARIG
jgi:hypothetical protein